MKRTLTMAIPLLCIAVLATMRCSLVSGPFAGGSGLGNPPTNVTIAMIADTGLVTASGQSGSSSLSLINNSDRALVLKDQGGLAYTVTSAAITVQYIRFLVAAPESLSALRLEQGLRCDNTGIIVTGPFVFDVMNGTVDPPLGHLALPPLTCTDVELLFNKKDPSNTDVPAVEISGEITYNNAVHGFLFNLTCDKLGTYAKKAGFQLHDSLVTVVIIRLNASSWLDSVDLGRCLDKGWIGFDPAGVLAVDDRMPEGCNKYNKVIADNIINSGRLEIRK